MRPKQRLGWSNVDVGDELLEVFTTSGYKWITLRRLTTAIGLDPDKPDDLDPTTQLLVHLPKPRPARADTTPPKPNQATKPRKEQLWGLTGVVG